MGISRSLKKEAEVAVRRCCFDEMASLAKNHRTSFREDRRLILGLCGTAALRRWLRNRESPDKVQGRSKIDSWSSRATMSVSSTTMVWFCFACTGLQRCCGYGLASRFLMGISDMMMMSLGIYSCFIVWILVLL